MQTKQFHFNIMGYMYLFSFISLVRFSNNACGFPASVPSNLLVSCTEKAEEIAKRCGSLKLSEILSSQGFTGPIMIAPMTTLFLPVIAKINSKNGAIDEWAGNYDQSKFPQNISSFSSNHINCQLYERYTQCIDEYGISDRCFSNEDFITRASYGYICGVGREEYLQSAKCLQRMDDYNALVYQSQAKAECRLNNLNLLDAVYGMMTTYKTTNVEQWLTVYLHNQGYYLCLIRERLHSCTCPWVRQQCGKKAESLVQGMVEQVMKSLTDFYKRVDSNFEIPSICAVQDAMNVQQHQGGMSETYVDQLLHDMHSAIDEIRPILGKCSSAEAIFNFIICGGQVIQEAPASKMRANSGSLLGWLEQACNSGLGRFQSCIEPKLESCPGGVIADIYNVIKATCVSFSDIGPMIGCYFPVVNNIESACGINKGELQALSSMITRYMIDTTSQSVFSKLATMIIQSSKSIKCAVQYQKNVTMSKLPQRCGSKFKYDVEHVFNLTEKTIEHLPKWIINLVQENQAINNYLNHIVCSDTAKGMVQKCGGQNLINSLDENSLFGTLLHNSRLNGFIHSQKSPQTSSHGIQRCFTHQSLPKNVPIDIFRDSAFTAETVSSTSVEKACRKYEAYEQCLDRTVDIFGCNTDSQIKSSWGYMCGKGKPDLMLSVSCLIDLDAIDFEEWIKGPEADTCRAAQRKSMTSWNSSAADMLCLSRACSAACLEAMAKSKCGQHASDFYRGLVESIVEGFVAHLQSIDPSFKPTNDCI